MTTTVANVKHKAGRLLGIVKRPESLRSEHDTLLTEAYDQEYDMLKKEGLAIWVSAGPVPDAVTPHLAALMAFRVANDLGISGDRYNRILADRNVAMPEIRAYVTPEHEYTDDPTDF